MTHSKRHDSPQQPVTTAAQPVTVSWNDLPLSCPRPGAPLWSLHPRVYLPIHESGRVQCPYCSTVYVLDVADEGDSLYPNIRIEENHALAVERTRRLTEDVEPGDAA
ncbi:MAG TPA: zinc-finger domain-containing protein [Arenicellales bacterium]|nr:zinc-finger domain-containing protein [Arenicellales bacterium]